MQFIEKNYCFYQKSFFAKHWATQFAFVVAYTVTDFSWNLATADSDENTEREKMTSFQQR